jgi:glyoxylase-like metal-dependent hydrolase (beta-lactamase superfamily II)
VAPDGPQPGTARGLGRLRGTRKAREPLEIAPNVFEIVLGRVRVHLIAEETLTLIDSGLPGSAASIDRAIAGIGRAPSDLRRIVCTHAHFDHAGGAAEIAARGDVEVLMHAADLASVQTTLADVARRPGRRLFVALTPQLERATPLADDDLIPALGGLRVVHVPGHTAGSICLYAPANGLLFVGDALQARLGKVGFASRLYSDDWQAACRAVTRLAALDVAAIVFAHYPVWRDDPNLLLRRLADEANLLDRRAYGEGTR